MRRLPETEVSLTSGNGGPRTKIVRRRLADGSVKEYRYDLGGKAAAEARRRASNAVHQIAVAYFSAPEFKSLSPSWQKAVRHYVSLIEDKLWWMTFEDLADRRARAEFYDLRDFHAAMPVKSDRLISVLKTLCSFAYERAMIAADHARGIPRLSPDRPVRADCIWLPEHETAFLGVAPPDIRMLYLMALYTAARQMDVARLRWDQIHDGWLSFQPSKTKARTGVWVHLPLYAFPPLKALVDSCQRQGDYILMTDSGVPWTPYNIKSRWLKTKAKAGITDDLHFHDLRGTAVTRMLEAGCTDAEAAAITGHALIRGAAMSRYASRSKHLAVNAYTKWWASMQPGRVVSIAGKRGRKTSENDSTTD
jgi:integrase